MTNYAIIASAFYGNKGAASMLEASLSLLDQPGDDDQFALLSVYPDEDRRLNPHANLVVLDATPIRLALLTNPLAVLYRLLPFARRFIRRIDPSIDFLANADVLLDQGGITFSDGREKFLPFNVATILPALVMGVPVVKCAQALGPFEGRRNRLVSKAILPRIHTIVARGGRTASLLAELDLDNVTEGVDLAFAMPVEESERPRVMIKAGLAPAESGLGNRIGICPSEVARKQISAIAGQDDTSYAAIVAQLVNWLVAEGNEVVLLPHSVRVGENRPHNNDLPLCRDIHGRLDDPAATPLVEVELSPEELRLIIGSFDLLITSRFHGMISALAAGVPPLVLGWGHKYREVLATFDLEDSGLDAKSLLDIAGVKANVTEVLNTLGDRQAKIATTLPLMVAKANEHQQLIAIAVDSK